VELWQRAFAQRFADLIAPAAIIAIGLAICNLTLFDEGPFHSASFVNLAVIAQHNGDTPNAERYLQQAAQHDPNSPEVWLQRATLEYKRGQLEEAKRTLRQAMARDREDHRPHLLMARIFFDQGNERRALHHRADGDRLRF
jgi:Tfp pilus assembly protein PilF